MGGSSVRWVLARQIRFGCHGNRGCGDVYGVACNPTGAVSRTKYDALGRVVETIDPTGVTGSATYDAVGRVLSTTSNGSTVTSTYDAAGHEVARTTEDGGVTTFEFGLDGELTRVVSPLGNIAGGDPTAFDTLLEYDADGNHTGTIDPLGRHTVNTFDGGGNVVSTTDPMAHTTSYTYTNLGAVATVTNAAGATTSYGYDALGRAVSATSPNGGVSTTEYDDAGRVASSTTPGGQTTTYSYDANGNVVLADLPDGEILRAYNSLGQPTLVDYSDATPDLTIEYDRAGRASEVSNGSVTAKYEYDLAGRVLKIARGSSTFTYRYDDEGRLVSKQYPDGRSEAFEWGPASRLAAMDLTIPVEVSKDVYAPVTNTVGYTYDVAGRVVQTARTNGPTTSNTFDAAGQLLSSVSVNGATTVASQTVQWDAVGLATQVTTTQSNSTKTVLFGYDSLGQVTSQCSPSSGVVCKSSSPKVTYAYDQNGNRTGETSGSVSTVHTYDADDRLVTSTAGAAVTSYSYGLNGDLESQTSPAGTVQYAYGLDGNLYNAVLADGRTVALAYDESGNRVQRNVNGVMTAKWVWDTNAALPVRTNESGASTFRWFEDPQSQLGTAVASVSKDGEPTWLIADFSGTTLTTAKTAGATSSAKFDPYGNILSGSMSQPLQFHGQYKDTVLGLYDMRQRDYNPVTGMFLATDPIAVPVGDPFISRYSYGFNNPLVFTDTSGLEPRAWKDGRIVGIPGVGGVSAAVAKAATKAAAKRQASSPNANRGGPTPTPSALPSVVVDCPQPPSCATGMCRGQSYLNTPHTDNTWSEAEWHAARDGKYGGQQKGGGAAPFGALGILNSGFDITWQSAWADNAHLRNGGARAIPIAGSLLAAAQSADAAEGNPLYSDLSDGTRSQMITGRAIFVGESTFLGGVGGAAVGGYITKQPWGVFLGDVVGSNAAYAGSSSLFDSVMAQFKQVGEEGIELGWDGDMPYLGRNDVPSLPGMPVPFDNW